MMAVLGFTGSALGGYSEVTGSPGFVHPTDVIQTSPHGKSGNCVFLFLLHVYLENPNQRCALQKYLLRSVEKEYNIASQ